MPPRPRFTMVQKKALWERDSVSGKAKCRLCKKVLEFTEMQIDHIVPLATGGEHHLANWQVLCMSCNTSKQDKPMSEVGESVLSPEELFEIRVHEEVMRRLKVQRELFEARLEEEVTKRVRDLRLSTSKPLVLSSSDTEEEKPRCEHIVESTGKQCKKYRMKGDTKYCKIHRK